MPARSRQPAVLCARVEHALVILTYAVTWRELVYVAFVIDAFVRRNVGWRASRTAYAGPVSSSMSSTRHFITGAGPSRWAHSSFRPRRAIRVYSFAIPNGWQRQSDSIG